MAGATLSNKTNLCENCYKCSISISPLARRRAVALKGLASRAKAADAVCWQARAGGLCIP
jgi:hypothetical protein